MSTGGFFFLKRGKKIMGLKKKSPNLESILTTKILKLFNKTVQFNANHSVPQKSRFYMKRFGQKVVIL